MTTAERARAVVLRHALDDIDAAHLLDMLGLGDDQPGPAPRVCKAPPARRRGTVHAVSAATDARLAEPPEPDPAPKPEPPTPARDPAPDPAPAERLCVDCGTPVVPQTRYRLDPDGYRARGIRLAAAHGCCHRCYYRRRHPVSAPKKRRAVKPASPHPKDITRASNDAELDRWATALVDANTQLVAAHAELAELRAHLTSRSVGSSIWPRSWPPRTSRPPNQDLLPHRPWPRDRTPGGAA